MKSNEDLLEGTKHIRFEVEMFFGCTKEICSKKEKSKFYNSLLITNWVIHARSLNDFLTKTRSKGNCKPDDILAEDYGFNNKVVILTPEIQEKMHKFVAHLSYKRRNDDNFEWIIENVYVKIQKSYHDFINSINNFGINFNKIPDYNSLQDSYFESSNFLDTLSCSITIIT